MKLSTSQFDFLPHLVNILFLSTILELRKETFYKLCTSCSVAACHSNPISNALAHVKSDLQVLRSNLLFRVFFSGLEVVSIFFLWFTCKAYPHMNFHFNILKDNHTINCTVFFQYLFFTYCLFIKSDPLVIHFLPVLYLY